MVDSQTTARADALKAAGDLGRTAVENLVKDAVAEAMHELDEERGSSTSNTSRISAAILLLGIGAIIGFALATSREGEPFETETEFGRPTETEPSAGTTTAGVESDESATESETDEDELDATTSD